MFCDRQQLNMRVAHLAYVFDELSATSAPLALAFMCISPPGPKMHFVDGYRRRGDLALSTVAHPFVIRPFKRNFGGYNRGRGGRMLRLPRKGVGLQRQQIPMRIVNRVLVAVAGCRLGHKHLPDAHLATQVHRIYVRVPAVEITDYRHSACVGRPDGETHATTSFVFDHVSAQAVGEVPMPPFSNQME